MSVKSLIKAIIPRRYHARFRELYKRCRYCFLFLLYIGNKFECPFCGGHFRKFFPDGENNLVLKEKNVVSGVYRLNSRCPRCDSLDRERLIYLYIANKTDLFQASQKKVKILHVAPEKNLQQVFISSPNINYLSADLNDPLAMAKMDITNIRYEDNLFDVIICCHVLEHVANDRKGMSEIHRVLKPGGCAILLVPISLSLERTYEDPTAATEEERVRVFGHKRHVRIYAQDYKDRLESVGFSVEVYNTIKEFGQSFMQKYALQKNENLYICSKPK